MAEIDRHSETWQAVIAWAERRRDMATRELVRGSASPGGDDRWRGEIRALDDLILLADGDDPPLPETSVTY